MGHGRSWVITTQILHEGSDLPARASHLAKGPATVDEGHGEPMPGAESTLPLLANASKHESDS